MDEREEWAFRNGASCSFTEKEKLCWLCGKGRAVAVGAYTLEDGFCLACLHGTDPDAPCPDPDADWETAEREVPRD